MQGDNFFGTDVKCGFAGGHAVEDQVLCPVREMVSDFGWIATILRNQLFFAPETDTPASRTVLYFRDVSWRSVGSILGDEYHAFGNGEQVRNSDLHRISTPIIQRHVELLEA